MVSGGCRGNGKGKRIESVSGWVVLINRATDWTLC